MSTGECISRLVALEGQVCLLRHQLSVEGKWRRRIESWLCRRFEDYELETDVKDEEGGEGSENYDKGRSGREVDDDDGYEGSDSKVNSTVAAALKDKRRLSSQSDEYHHDNYDVIEVDEDDINQEECEDLSPKRFKIHHPPPPLQKRPDVPVRRRESNETPLQVIDSRAVHARNSVYRKKQDVIIEQEDVPENEGEDRRSGDAMPWKDSEEVEVINVEPCLDIEYDDDDGGGNQEQWENSNDNNEYSADEDEAAYDFDDALNKMNDVLHGEKYFVGPNFKSTASKSFVAREKLIPSPDGSLLYQTLNSSGPPKLIAIKPKGASPVIKLKSLNQRSINSIPSTSHANSILKSYSPAISLKGSATVVSLSEVYAQAKIDRSRLNQWNQIKPGQPRVQTIDGSSVKPGGLLKKSTTYEQLQNRSILDMSTRNKQPGECPHCGKTFNTPAEMMRHTRIHTGEKPYKCYACTYATSFNGDLVRHLKSRHPGMDPYVCHLCDFKCQELLMFNNHRRKTGHGGRGSSTLNVKESYSVKAESSYAESENF